MPSTSTTHLFYLLCGCAVLSAGAVNGVNGDHHSISSVTNSYGERLADSSFTYSTLTREPKDESNIYSSGINAILNSDGFLGQMERFNSDPKYTPTGPVEMAVHTKKTVEVIPVRFEEPKEGDPQVIEITPYEVPLSIVFKTQTNKINVNQEHKSEAAEEVRETSSEEEPHRVVHNVYRPVIQEVTEVIQPYRKVLQKVEPVIEEMKTIISKAGPPPDGSVANYQGQANYQSNKGSAEFIRFGGQSDDSQSTSRYGNPSLNIIPVPYGSELIKKLANPPTSLSSSTSTVGASSSPLSANIDTKPNESKIDNAASNENKDTDYNDIIKRYISNLLEQKKALPATATNEPINPNSIKILNIPTKDAKNRPTVNINGEEKKFKIIKEFRITLDDIKKQMKHARNIAASSNQNAIILKPKLSRYEPFRPEPRSEFARRSRPLTHLKGPVTQRSRHFGEIAAASRVNARRVALRPPPREMTRRISTEPLFTERGVRNFQSRPLEGLSPPNLMFSGESRHRQPREVVRPGLASKIVPPAARHRPVHF